jgi:hypothetical protein
MLLINNVSIDDSKDMGEFKAFSIKAKKILTNYKMLRSNPSGYRFWLNIKDYFNNTNGDQNSRTSRLRQVSNIDTLLEKLKESIEIKQYIELLEQIAEIMEQMSKRTLYTMLYQLRIDLYMCLKRNISKATSDDQNKYYQLLINIINKQHAKRLSKILTNIEPTWLEKNLGDSPQYWQERKNAMTEIIQSFLQCKSAEDYVGLFKKMSGFIQQFTKQYKTSCASIPYKWFVFGEGELYNELTKIIEHTLQHVLLNPRCKESLNLKEEHLFAIKNEIEIINPIAYKELTVYYVETTTLGDLDDTLRQINCVQKRLVNSPNYKNLCKLVKSQGNQKIVETNSELKSLNHFKNEELKKKLAYFRNHIIAKFKTHKIGISLRKAGFIDTRDPTGLDSKIKEVKPFIKLIPYVGEVFNHVCDYAQCGIHIAKKIAKKETELLAQQLEQIEDAAFEMLVLEVTARFTPQIDKIVHNDYTQGSLATFAEYVAKNLITGIKQVNVERFKLDDFLSTMEDLSGWQSVVGPRVQLEGESNWKLFQSNAPHLFSKPGYYNISDGKKSDPDSTDSTRYGYRLTAGSNKWLIDYNNNDDDDDIKQLSNSRNQESKAYDEYIKISKAFIDEHKTLTQESLNRIKKDLVDVKTRLKIVENKVEVLEKCHNKIENDLKSHVSTYFKIIYNVPKILIQLKRQSETKQITSIKCKNENIFGFLCKGFFKINSQNRKTKDIEQESCENLITKQAII